MSAWSRAWRALPLLWLATAWGCADPIKVWQSSLQEYVAQEGNGDLNILRRLDPGPAQSDYGVIGAAGGGVPFVLPSRTDANGVLLGLRRIDRRSWYVYLVGAVEYRGAWSDFPLDDPDLLDVRLVAFSARDGVYDWRVSDRDDEALARYRAPQIAAWRQSHPARAGATRAPTTFPSPADDFRLSVESEVLRVVDDHSLAQWLVPLGADAGRGEE